MNTNDLFHAGKLREAIAAATDEVRAHPTDPGPRLLLSELLCFTGELERADRQLEAINQSDPKIMPWVIAFRHLIRAGQARQDFFNLGSLPEFLHPPDEVSRALLEASIRLREGATAEALPFLAQAEDLRPKVTGECNGKPFQDLRDLDDQTSCIFEVLTTNGRYYWIPIAEVEEMEFHEPTRPRDLLWRQVHMIVRGGPDGEVFLPAVYPGAEVEADAQYQLGRLTDWRGGDGSPVRGVGQRTFLVGEDAVPILELKSLSIHHSDQDSPT